MMKTPLKRIRTLGVVFGAVCLGPVFAWSHTVSGTVLMEGNGNGAYPLADRPLEGVTVVVENLDGTFVAEASTEPDGRFSITVDARFVPDTFTCRLSEATLPAGVVVIYPGGGSHTFELSNLGDQSDFREADFILRLEDEDESPWDQFAAPSNVETPTVESVSRPDVDWQTSN